MYKKEEKKLVVKELERLTHFLDGLTTSLKNESPWGIELLDLEIIKEHLLGYYDSRTGRKVPSWKVFTDYVDEKESIRKPKQRGVYARNN